MENKGKKMSPLDVTLMAVGAIIGAGVFSMTGVAVGAAGPGVPIAFLIAGVAAMMVCLPFMVISSAIPVRGGQYLYVARFLSPVLGFLLVWNLVFEIFYVSVLGISAGQYLPNIIPGLSPRLAGTIVVIGIVTACLFNIRTSAKIQNFMVILVLIALGLFIVLGIPHIKHISLPKMVAGSSFSGIILAVSYVRSSAYGAVGVVDLAGEVEHPQKTVPSAIATSTIGVSVLYAVVAFIAVGVVPWEEMIQQPLSYAAKSYMPVWIFSFFVIGGALFAILTTLLSMIMSYSRAIWAAADDGLFPKWLQSTNRFGIPYKIILIMGAIGLLPVVLDLPLDYVFAVMNAPGMMLGLLATVPVLIAPRKLEGKFEHAWFRMPKWIIWTLVLGNIALTLVLSFSLFATLDLKTILGILLFYGGGIVYFFLRVSLLKKRGVDLITQMKTYDPSWLKEN